jgi:hypothetical protein
MGVLAQHVYYGLLLHEVGQMESKKDMIAIALIESSRRVTA